MANFINKLFGGSDDDEYYDDYEDEPVNQSQPAPAANYQQQNQSEAPRRNAFGLGNNNNQNQQVPPIQSVSANQNQNTYYQQSPQQPQGQSFSSTQSSSLLNVIRPKVFSDAKPIVQSLLQNIPVIIDFSAIDEAQTNRAIDFLSGAIFAIKGNMSKVTEGIFVVGPQGYVVEGDIISSSINAQNNNMNQNPYGQTYNR
ncbi:MAG: cell division protein SepF [Lactobacillaceae bacterium]|jgi:cell division inhibitor SepF|nr:cell division protein SepF [Lactobacillaceae bacterium]